VAGAETQEDKVTFLEGFVFNTTADATNDSGAFVT
jgi:hypothetical protein